MDHTYPTIDESEIKNPLHQQLKKRILNGMLINAFVFGVVMGIVMILGHDPEESQVLDLIAVLFAIILIILLFIWIEYDARQHSFKLGFPLRVFLILFALIAVPYYLFRVRGLAAFKTIFIMMLFFCLLIVILGTASVLMGILGIMMGFEF